MACGGEGFVCWLSSTVLVVVVVLVLVQWRYARIMAVAVPLLSSENPVSSQIENLISDSSGHLSVRQAARIHPRGSCIPSRRSMVSAPKCVVQARAATVASGAAGDNLITWAWTHVNILKLKGLDAGPNALARLKGAKNDGGDRTHFTYRVDLWTSDGVSIAEHLAGAEDFQLALATYRAPVEPRLRRKSLKRLTRRRTPYPPAALRNPPDENAPADSRPAYERAALLWHGKSLWCRHCFASQIAAAEAETGIPMLPTWTAAQARTGLAAGP